MKYLSLCVIFIAFACSLETSGRSTASGQGVVADPGMDAAPAPPDGDGDGAAPIQPDGSLDGDDGSPRDAGADDGDTDPGQRDSGMPHADAGPKDAGQDASVPETPDAGEQGGGDDDPADPEGYTPPPGEVGAPCSANNQCSGRFALCLSINFPNGYCTHSCPCGPDEVCSAFRCRRACDSDDDCRVSEGYVCKEGACATP